MPHVVLQSVTRTHPAPRGAPPVVALRDLSFSVEPGEFIVLLGPSGSGKTTTLRLVAGLDAPDSGNVRFDGREMQGIPPHQRGIAMVFQDHPLLPHLSVGENIVFGLRLARLSGREIAARLEETTTRLGLREWLDRAPDTLSGGERQRVALASALVRRPRLLLLDEPLGQLDLPLRLRLRAEIRRWQRDASLTVIHVTHDQSEALALADRLLILRAGETQQIATPPEAYRNPANAFVAGFLGCPAMNLVPGRFGIAGSTASWSPAEGPPWLVATTLPDRPGACSLGVRPEDILLAPSSAPGSTAIPARVTLVEFMGDHALVHLLAGSAELVARTRPDTALESGAETTVSFRPEAIRFFDAATGRSCPP